jgi:hypothetical protein
VDPSDWRLERELLEMKAATIFDREIAEEHADATKSNFRVALAQYTELFTVSHLNRRLMIACLL